MIYTRLTKIPFAVLLTIVLATVGMGVWAQGAPLVSLDAAKLADGPLAAWDNTGSLAGSFKSIGTSPQVKTIDGVKAVDFDGKQYMLGDFNAPASITGDKPWTVIVKVYARDIGGERTLLSWANRPGNCMEIEYGDAPFWGALGTWGEFTTGWLDKVPAKNQWHTLIYSYAGGKDGEFQAWGDGDLIVLKKGTIATKDGRPFVLGACMLDDPEKKPGYIHFIDAAIASVQVYDRGYSQIECWKAGGKTAAYPVAPRPNTQLDTLTANLQWVPAADGVASYDLYFDADQASVENSTNESKAGRVYKGKQTTTSFGPISLDINKAYYWRVDQLDASGKMIARGVVSKFTTESGNASDPTPADSYIFVEGGKHILSWKPGKYAVKQNVYVGETAQAVLGKKKPDFAGLDTKTASVDLPIKNPIVGQNYYWRVESINGKPYSTSKGDVWSFRTVSKKLKVYISSGQSNAVGCSMASGLPDKYKGFNKNVIIIVRGECRLVDYGWAYLRDGLGSGFGDRDGKGTFGPELLFGCDMAPTDPTQVMAIVKISWGGTNLRVQWRPPSAGGTTGDLYTNWVKFYHEALSKLDPAFEPEIAGMIWMQGESDTGDPAFANEYESNLTNFIKDIRAEVKKPNMPFVLATISKFDAWKAYGDVVRAAEAKVAETVPHCATFPTDDYGQCDPWHYDTPGMVSLGQRFARAMKGLESGK